MLTGSTATRRGFDVTVTAKADANADGSIGLLWMWKTGVPARTMNDCLRSHWTNNRHHTQNSRDAACWLTRPYYQKHGPFTRPVTVKVQQTWVTGRPPDPGAPMPEIKAWIDGIVDAKLLDDDTGAHVSRIMFLAPHQSDVQRLTMLITPDQLRKPLEYLER